MSKIRDFLESDIRKMILLKIPEGPIKKGGKHWKATLIVDDIIIDTIKVPNDHKRIMHATKSQYIARSLCLDNEQFNDFVVCNLKANEYLDIIRKTQIDNQSAS
jgi:hypothetical protein